CLQEEGDIQVFLVTGVQACALPFSAAAIVRHRVTAWGCITAMAIDLLSAPGVEQRDLSSLRRIGGGGAAMPAAIAARLRKLTGLDRKSGGQGPAAELGSRRMPARRQ